MKRLLAMLFAVVLFAVTGPSLSRAEDDGKSEHWYDRISLGGELRLRNENQINYAPITGGVDDDSFILLRARPHIDARPIEGLRIFIQPQFSRVFAQEESTIANNGDAANPGNVFDLHQGFATWENIAGSVVSVTAGRQELSYGDERLIGAFNWSNIGRSFDAGKIRLAWEDLWVDGFFAWNEKTAGNEYFGGLYSGWKLRPDMTLDTYALLLRDNDGDAVATITETTIGTAGARFAGTAFENRFDYNLEAAVQFGKNSPNNHLAYAGHGAFGYTWDTAWKPRLGAEYNFASGDDPGTATTERFNNLFPTNHDKYGYIDFASWSNIHDIVASGSVKPRKDLSVKLDYHLFLLPEPSNGLFRASGALLRAGAAGASSLAGHEVDLLTKYSPNKYVNFLVGYSLFRGGSFFDDTGTNGTAHFLYTQATVAYY